MNLYQIHLTRKNKPSMGVADLMDRKKGERKVSLALWATSLALLVQIQPLYAMDPKPTEQEAASGQLRSHDYYKAELQKLEESTRRIHEEVDRILQEFRKNMEEYYRTTRGTSVAIATLDTGTPRVGKEAATEKDKQGAITEGTAGKKGTEEEQRANEAMRNINGPLDRKITIQEKVNQLLNESDIPFSLLDKLDGMGDEEKINWLNEKLAIQKKVSQVNQQKVEKAKRLDVDVSSLYDLIINHKDIQNIDGWLDRKISIEEKKGQLKELGVPISSNFETKDDGEKIKWLDKKITIQEKKGQLKKLGVPSSFFDILLSKSDEEKIEWLNKKIPIEEKMALAKKLGVPSSVLGTLGMKMLGDDEKIKWLDEKLAIKVKLAQANQEKLEKAKHLGVELDSLYDLGINHTDIQNINGWLDGKITIQEKVDQLKASDISSSRWDKFDEMMWDEDKNEWLDEKLEIQKKVSQANQEKVKKAKGLGVKLDPLYALKVVNKDIQNIDGWLDRKIEIEEKTLEATKLGASSSFFSNLRAKDDGEKIKSLNHQITIREKTHKAETLGVPSSFFDNLVGKGDEEKIRLLNIRITIEEKKGQAKKLGVPSSVLGTLDRVMWGDGQTISWLDGKIEIGMRLAQAGHEKVEKAKALGVDLSPLYNQSSKVDNKDIQSINGWLDRKIPIQEKLVQLKALGGDSSFFSNLENKDDGEKIKWLDKKITIQEKKGRAKDLGLSATFLLDGLLDIMGDDGKIKWLDTNITIQEKVVQAKALGVHSSFFDNLVGKGDEEKIRLLNKEIQAKQQK